MIVAGPSGAGLLLLAPALLAFLLGALASIALPSPRTRAWGGAIGAFLGAGAAALAGARVLATGTAFDGRLDSAVPFVALAVHVDALAAVALLLLGLVAGAVALYLPAHFADVHADPARLGFFLNVLFASLVVVFSAAHTFTFLVAWETMSLAGFFLVLHDDARPEARKAGATYFVMAHLGTAFLLAAFAALFVATGSLDFASYRDLVALGGASALLTLAFVGAFVGFALKAGLVPLHGWLPSAYAEAPTPATAAMSGIMSKAAVFVFARVAFLFLGAGPAWWGAVVFAVGLASALLGILYATQERDLKRLLAYSSIENLGIVFAALGLAMLFLSEGQDALALLAALAALYHTANHAATKTLLFLAAGNVERAAGTRDLERLGGLARRMPWTAALFLLGAFALAALPPMNGFVSEWLLFRSLALGLVGGSSFVVAGLAAAGIAILALAGGLAVLAFVRAQGIAFHALPRSEGVANAREVALGRIAPLVLLALACVALSLAAAPIAGALALAVAPFSPGLAAPVRGGTLGSFGPVVAAGTYGPALVAALVLAFALVALLVFRPRRAPERRAAVWACGYETSNPRATYSALATGKAVRMLFSSFLLPERTFARSTPATANERRVPRFESIVVPAVETYVYEPVARATRLASERLRVLQRGSVRLYLGYVLIVLVALLLILAVAP